MINKKAKHGWHAFAFIGFIAAMGGITMLLWNVLVPAIFGGFAINYFQALGLLVLSRLLFGGFGFHHFGRWCHGGPHHHHDLRQMHNMSREERKEYIRRHMAEHGFCCDDKKETPAGEQAE